MTRTTFKVGQDVKVEHRIRNEISDRLEVWVEPWCHPYKVRRGSVLTLRFKPDRRCAGLEMELNCERLVVWPDSDHAPEAEIDGRKVEPDWE